ncbi:MAG: 30S ribosomal protein S8e [Candidatus Thermoplasmatota archaeon]|jgi:small subunit ribosomal protein S8e|nr:30S ribosomal protein S8e [Candidatus Thermoplasmatota archaeon]
MAIYHGRASVKTSGGKLRSNRHKKRFELGNEPTLTVLGNIKRKQVRGMGGNSKSALLSGNEVNVTNPKDRVTKRVKILNVKENIADPHFAQRNIITKGAIVVTELGNARITSRPGQSGRINAVLIKK